MKTTQEQIENKFKHILIIKTVQFLNLVIFKAVAWDIERVQSFKQVPVVENLSSQLNKIVYSAV